MRPCLTDGLIDHDRILAAVLVPHRAHKLPEGQAALLAALIAAMGALAGEQPVLSAIAARLGVHHRTLYRTLAVLEAKGIVVRARARIEIRLPGGNRARRNHG